MLLLVDHLALRARNYEYLIRLFQEWEVGVHVRCLPRSLARAHAHSGWAHVDTCTWVLPPA